MRWCRRCLHPRCVVGGVVARPQRSGYQGFECVELDAAYCGPKVVLATAEGKYVGFDRAQRVPHLENYAPEGRGAIGRLPKSAADLTACNAKAEIPPALIPNRHVCTGGGTAKSVPSRQHSSQTGTCAPAEAQPNPCPNGPPS
jgi:hypothetical protein